MDRFGYIYGVYIFLCIEYGFYTHGIVFIFFMFYGPCIGFYIFYVFEGGMVYFYFLWLWIVLWYIFIFCV